MTRPATSRLKINPPTGTPPTLEWIVPGDLSIDEGYQRSLATESAQALIRRIAMFWDWSLCQPINVARRENGALMVVDGQHRHAAALLRGDIKALPCVIAEFTDLAAEAAAFVALNKERRPLNSVDVFRAQLAAGDAMAKTVADLIASAGLTIATHSNFTAWQAGMLYCVPTIVSGYRRHGHLVVSSALCALSEAFEGQVLRYAGNMLEGLIPFYAAELREAAFDADIFIEELGAHPQSEWISRARIHMAAKETNRKSAMQAVLTDAYLAALRKSLEPAS